MKNIPVMVRYRGLIPYLLVYIITFPITSGFSYLKKNAGSKEGGSECERPRGSFQSSGIQFLSWKSSFPWCKLFRQFKLGKCDSCGECAVACQKSCQPTINCSPLIHQVPGREVHYVLVTCLSSNCDLCNRHEQIEHLAERR